MPIKLHLRKAYASIVLFMFSCSSAKITSYDVISSPRCFFLAAPLHLQHSLSTAIHLNLISALLCCKYFQLANYDRCQKTDFSYACCLACTRKYQQTKMTWSLFPQNRCHCFSKMLAKFRAFAPHICLTFFDV